MEDIKYVSLNDSLFLGGKNHGLKVFNGKGGVTIEYDGDHDHVKVYYGAEEATVKHYSTIVCSTTKQTHVPTPQNPVPRGKIKAQVSTPQDHVFSEGPGKTRT